MPYSTAKTENVQDENNAYLEIISKSLQGIDCSLQNIYELGFIWSQPIVLSYLSHIFKSTAQLKAYLLSDGVLSTREIGKIINSSHQTIKNWWDKWSSEFDIVERDRESGSYRKRYSLADLVAIFGNEQEKENEDEQSIT